MDLTKKTAAELKQIALRAIQQQDRNMLAKLKTEALRRAEARIENGTATEKLKDLTKKL